MLKALFVCLWLYFDPTNATWRCRPSRLQQLPGCRPSITNSSTPLHCRANKFKLKAAGTDIARLVPQGVELMESEGGVEVAVRSGRPNLEEIVLQAAKGMTSADRCIVCASGNSTQHPFSHSNPPLRHFLWVHWRIRLASTVYSVPGITNSKFSEAFQAGCLHSASLLCKTMADGFVSTFKAVHCSSEAEKTHLLQAPHTWRAQFLWRVRLPIRR